MYEEELSDLDFKLQQEEKLWERDGINKSMLGFDLYMMNLKFVTLFKIISEKLDLSEEEMNLIFKETALEQLREDRKKLVKAKKMANFALPQRPGIIGPNGTPLN